MGYAHDYIHIPVKILLISNRIGRGPFALLVSDTFHNDRNTCLQNCNDELLSFLTVNETNPIKNKGSVNIYFIYLLAYRYLQLVNFEEVVHLF